MYIYLILFFCVLLGALAEMLFPRTITKAWGVSFALLAAALGVPAFVIFGAADPAMVKPYHPLCVYPIKAALNCASPCIKKPCSYPPECLSKITPQTVYEMIQKQVNISVSVT